MRFAVFCCHNGKLWCTPNVINARNEREAIVKARPYLLGQDAFNWSVEELEDNVRLVDNYNGTVSVYVDGRETKQFKTTGTNAVMYKPYLKWQ